jgi:uncharacterized protein (DUF736 family)
MPFGALFKVKQKRNDKAPDYNGNIDVDKELIDLVQSGAEKIQLAGWLKTSKAGSKYISLRVSAPYEKSNNSGGQRASTNDDDVPF